MVVAVTLLGLFSPVLMAHDAPNQSDESVSPAHSDTLRAQRDQQVRDSLIGSNPEQNFSLYKLNYAIANDDDLLLQYSFKYRVIDELYLAYTNLVLWDIYHAEQPSIDNNFMPELFYRFMLERGPLVSVDAGWFHRSNGMEGPDSRAWDRWRVAANSEFAPFDRQLLWSFAVFADMKKSSKNEDINEYIGPWESNLTWRNVVDYRGHELDIGFRLVPGDGWVDFERGQKMLGLHYRLPWKAFRPTLYFQYFHGYGEVIRFYNVEQEAFRAGFSFHY